MRFGRVWLLLVFGCGAAPAECPPALATVAEMRAAREHGRKAAASTKSSTSRPHVWDEPYRGRSWYPWFYYWDPDLEQARLAAAGLERSQALELEHRAACNGIPERAQARSSLDTYAMDSTRLGHGVIVHLAADVGPPEVLLVALRCHRAWLGLIPRVDARDDLLALDGVKLVVHAGARDGIDVLFSSDEAGLLPEIERRARVAVARAKRVRDMVPP